MNPHEGYAVWDNPHTMCRECWHGEELIWFYTHALMIQTQFSQDFSRVPVWVSNRLVGSSRDLPEKWRRVYDGV